MRVPCNIYILTHLRQYNFYYYIYINASYAHTHTQTRIRTRTHEHTHTSTRLKNTQIYLNTQNTHTNLHFLHPFKSKLQIHKIFWWFRIDFNISQFRHTCRAKQRKLRFVLLFIFSLFAVVFFLQPNFIPCWLK